jgi:VanZ family protein
MWKLIKSMWGNNHSLPSGSAGKDFLKYNWPSFLWAAFILWLCLMPASHLPKVKIPNFDKIVHFSFYFTLSTLMVYGWSRQQSIPWLRKHSIIKIIIIASAYGLSIEIMQELFTNDRHFEWLDEAANATGAVVGTLFAVKLFKELIRP